MTNVDDLLIEIGTEELPPGALQQLGLALFEGLVKELTNAQLIDSADDASWFTTPRRLAVRIPTVATAQEDREEQRLGPAVAAAFDEAGQATPAAQGFARSCGVAVDDLQRVATDKGERLGLTRRVAGQSLAQMLPDILARCCAGLPIPRPMRWGTREDSFVRPVHWIVALHGDTVVPGELFGRAFGRTTRGHRFHHPQPVKLAHALAYEADLLQAFVQVDTEQRRATIAERSRACVSGDAQVVMRDELLTEVANLCEWPVPLLGEFDEAFLQVPAQALRSSMEKHQRFFPVVDGQGNLKALFVAVANLESQDPAQVKAGFERVITPRLADARFFWSQDLKVTLADRRPALDRVVYQKQLGSLGDKVNRLQQLAPALAAALGHDGAAAEEAAGLCKSDLLSAMVGEFPELQGVMGRHYAQAQQHPAEVCSAIEEHYLPRFAGDSLPGTTAGQVLALADRIDTLCGIFAVGMKPSGNRDPFALRRAALGLVRIMIEGRLDLDLLDCFELGFAGVEAQVKLPDGVGDQLLDFVMDRMRAYYAERGVAGDIFEAVWARRPTRPLDFDQRVAGLVSFAKLPASAALAAANKRIGNLLRKAAERPDDGVNPALFAEAAEGALYEALQQTVGSARPQIEQRDYSGALQGLAGLREVVDDYFDGVMVMAEETSLRNNRLALLSDVKDVFDDIADISQLKVAS